MTKEARSAVRTSEPESAKPELAPIGARLGDIRASLGLTQPRFAALLGASHKSYTRWERGVREPSVEGLQALVMQGWNVNWLLTGEGPNRLEALPDKGFQASEGVRKPSSQSVVSPHLKMALSMVEDELAQKQAYLPPGRRVDAAVLVCELLAKGLPEAEVVALAGQTVGMLIEGSGGRDAGKAPTGSET